MRQHSPAILTSRTLRRSPRRRGFTLIELLLASMISVIVVGSLSMSIGQLGRSRDLSKQRLHGYLRADAGLNALRSDIISVVRTDDLFFTRLLIVNDTTSAGDRDEILVFNTRLRPVRDMHQFTGEGIEYETHYRIEDDEYGTVLWRRRDNMPDEYPQGGGVATPLIEGLVGLSLEAYDGYEWLEEWDSDIDGLPLAVRITVTASGHRDDEDAYAGPFVDLRTIVPIDRVLPPRDIFEEEERILEEIAAAEAAAQGAGGPEGLGGDFVPEGFDGEVFIDEDGNVVMEGEEMPRADREAAAGGGGAGPGGGTPGGGGGGGPPRGGGQSERGGGGFGSGPGGGGGSHGGGPAGGTGSSDD